jgi:hypothetical protein
VVQGDRTDDVEAALVAVLGHQWGVDHNEVTLDQPNGTACGEE